METEKHDVDVLLDSLLFQFKGFSNLVLDKIKRDAEKKKAEEDASDKADNN